MCIQMKNLMMAVASVLLLAAASQVQAAAQYHCRSINVCGGAVDMKWTEQTASKALGMYKASLAFKAAPARSACITSACKTPVTVNLKLAASASRSKLDAFIAAVIKNPKQLSSETSCVEDNTAAMLAGDKTCLASEAKGTKGSVLCRSTEVCSDMEDFKWVQQQSKKALTAFLMKHGLPTDGITVSKDVAAHSGCSCSNPSLITVTAKVPSGKSFSALDAALAAELKNAVVPKLKPACSADATAAFVAANLICKATAPVAKVTVAPVAPAATTVLCHSIEVCDNAVDFKWTKNTLTTKFAELYKTLGVPQTPRTFSVTKLKGTTVAAGDTSCTCKNKALVNIKVPVKMATPRMVGSGGAMQVMYFLATLQPKLPEVQCMAFTSDSCGTDSSAVSTCRSWTLCDDNTDFKWTTAAVKKALAGCFSSTGTPTAALKITKQKGTCAMIGSKQCCCATVAAVKVTSVPAGKGPAFDACANAAMKLPNKCLGQAKCLGAGSC